MSKNERYVVDRDFQKLAIGINRTLIRNKANLIDEESQKKQVEQLMALEIQLLNIFNKYLRTQEIYETFIEHVTKDIGNLIVGQIYFRATKSFYMKNIAPAFKSKDIKQLMKFHPNYALIQFVIDNWGSELPKAIDVVYRKFIYHRQVLIENNMPLAINRAKKFYKKAPKGNLDLLDLVNICIAGLIRGIDKYEGAYKPVWRSVCIGHMVSFMLEEYNNYLVRMFPTEKKILYRVNGLRYKLKTNDITILTNALNKSFEQDRSLGRSTPNLPIDQFQVMSLLNSSNHTTIIAPPIDNGDDGVDNYLEIVHEDKLMEAIEHIDTMRQVQKASTHLLLIERKVIQLKGVEI